MHTLYRVRGLYNISGDPPCLHHSTLPLRKSVSRQLKRNLNATHTRNSNEALSRHAKHTTATPQKAKAPSPVLTSSVTHTTQKYAVAIPGRRTCPCAWTWTRASVPAASSRPRARRAPPSPRPLSPAPAPEASGGRKPTRNPFFFATPSPLGIRPPIFQLDGPLQIHKFAPGSQHNGLR